MWKCVLAGRRRRSVEPPQQRLDRLRAAKPLRAPRCGAAGIIKAARPWPLSPSSATSRRKGARLLPRPKGRGFRRGNSDEAISVTHVFSLLRIQLLPLFEFLRSRLFCMPSLRKIWCKCAFTVPSPRPNSRATSLFVNPRATRSATFNSLGLSTSEASIIGWFRSLELHQSLVV